MIRVLLLACLVFIAPVALDVGNVVVAAEQAKKKKKKETRRMPAITERTHRALMKAQALIDPESIVEEERKKDWDPTPKPRQGVEHLLDMLDKQYDSTKTPELKKIKKVISKSVPRYIDQLGETALTAINIATDYIKYIENTSNVNVLQSKPLQWGMKLSKPGFKMDDYLKEQSRYNRETYKQIAA